MNKFIKTFILLLFAFLTFGSSTSWGKQIQLPVIPNAKFDVTKYGASTSSADNAEAIQKTIDACSDAGGGSVVIPAGTYMCGPLMMKSHVNLYVSKGAMLKMLPYGNGNGIEPNTFPNNGTPNKYPHFIGGNNVHDIMVSGEGIIDGQGAEWWKIIRDKSIPDIKRGCIIRWENCKRMEVKDITLQNSPNVHITIGKGSTDATITHVTIKAPNDSPNTDGIDTWAQNINISYCNISTGDDNVAMDRESSNITIKHCKFGFGHGCSIGSFTTNVNNVLVDSCDFKNTTSGIRMKSNRGRGGNEQNITYSNITMDGVKFPIFISSYYPKPPKEASDADQSCSVDEKTPGWKDITIRNVKATNCTNNLFIWGLPELHVSNILLENVKIESAKGITINYADNVNIKNSQFSVADKYIIQIFKSIVNGLN